MSKATRSGRILVVEDHALLADTLAATLELEGYEPIVARSLAAARSVLAETTPACIVLDGVLGDGEAHTLIRELATQNKRIPIVLCSASPGVERVASEFHLQNVGKPYDLDILLSALESAMSR